jgi:magnesium transporter
MLHYFINDETAKIKEVHNIQPNCWIHLLSPTEKEIQFIAEKTGTPKSFLYAALDENESAHYDVENDSVLCVIDTPHVYRETGTIETTPFALIQNKSYLISVATKDHHIFRNFFNGKVKGLNINNISKTIYQIILYNASQFMPHLRQIDSISEEIQSNLTTDNMKNNDIVKLLELQKTLVYFSASLAANNALVSKIATQTKRRSNMTEEELEILDDAGIENRQGIEMCQIYREIIKNSMDTYDALINNTQNNSIRWLTILNALVVIPTWIAGLMGMNVPLPLDFWGGYDNYWNFWIYFSISIVLSVLCILPFIRKKHHSKSTPLRGQRRSSPPR